MALGSETPTTDTPANTTQSPNTPAAGSISNLHTQPVYLYAFVFIAVLVISFVLCSLWRGFVIRRRRRELGLPELEGPYGFPTRSVAPEVKLNPPVMHDVYIRDTRALYGAEEKRREGAWRTLEPVSTTLIDTSEDTPQPDIPDPTRVTFGDMLKELSPHRWVRRSKPRNPALEKDGDAMTPDYHEVVTSVLIAMPSPPDQRRPPGDELPMPEVSFGVYEGPWSRPSAVA